MANKKKHTRLIAKESGWWPETWVPLACDGGPADGHTIPYDPKYEPTHVVRFPGEGRYVRSRVDGVDAWAWEPSDSAERVGTLGT